MGETKERILTMLPFAAFFDLDGTLAMHNQPPAAVDVEAMRAFRARGNYLFLCTGRSAGYLYPAVLDIGFDGIIAGAGAYVLLGEELLYRTAVPNSVLLPIQRLFEQSTATLIMETEQNMVQLASPSAQKLVAAYPRIYTAAEWQKQYSEEVTSKLTVYGDMPSSVLSAVQGALDVIQHPTYAELVPKGCSKSNGIQRILTALNLPREQSIAFGDSMNDYDMLEYVGVGVAMGNADERVKAIADRVTAPYDQGGIAQVLCEYLEKL
ncbi:MAG: HAD family hydrolase [Clostridia bacterium]|nr:HAD family hydrolase [Clostridia bacterium]